MFMNVESGSERTRSGKYAMQMDVANEKQDGNWIIPSHTKLEKGIRKYRYEPEILT